MSAFVTGGTGFVGKRLVRRLLQRDNEPVYILVYKPTPELIAGLKEFWGADAGHATSRSPTSGSRPKTRASSKAR